MMTMQRGGKRNDDAGHSLCLHGVTRQMQGRFCSQKVIELVRHKVRARMGMDSGQQAASPFRVPQA